MASLATLPTELVVFVLENFDTLHDLASLARLDRRLYNIVNPILYKEAVDRGSTLPLAWAAQCGVPGTLFKALEAGIDPNFSFVDNQTREAWNKARAATQASEIQHEDPEPWSSDRGSESDHHIDWTPDTTDSDRAGSSNQPLSVSSRSGPYVEYYEPSKSEYRSDFPSEYSDDEMMDAFDYPEDVSVATHPEPEPAALGLPTPKAVDSTGPIPRRFSALHLAARGGHTDVIRILLDHGANISAESENFCDCGRMYGLLNAAECPELELTPLRWSPLHTAICHANTDAAKLLLSRGASSIMDVSTDPTTKSSATALHHAAATGLTEIVSYLAYEGIQPNIDPQDEKTLTPLYYAYASRRWDSTLPMLLQLGANINVDTKMFLPYCTITPLGEALRLGHWEAADRLIALGADVKRGFIATPQGGGLSPLHLSAMKCARPIGQAVESRIFEEEDRGFSRMQTIANLVARGATLDARDCSGDDPLLSAAQGHIVPGVRALIRAGADVHSRNGIRRTALMLAVIGPANPGGNATQRSHESFSQIVRELLDAGALIDDTDSDGNNVLHLVFKANTAEQLKSETEIALLRLLLNKPGASRLFQITNSAGYTPLQLAFLARNYEACDIFLRRGNSASGITPHQFLDMFKFALADPDADGRTRAMNLVLDMDVDQVLTSDATLFTHLLAESGEYALTAAALISQRGLPPLGAYDYTSLLCQAIETGDFFLAYNLVEAGADVNATNGNGYTPLVLFLNRDAGKTDTEQSRVARQLLQAMLDRGANIHLQSPYVRPLTKAIVEGWPTVVSSMLKKSPLRGDPRAADGCYLHDAVVILRGVRRVPNEKIIDSLISSGASLTELNHEGDTPLSVLLRSLCNERALAWRYHRFIRLLLGPGVDANRTNKVGMSAVDYLEQLLQPPPGDVYQADFIARRFQVVQVEGGVREIRILSQPRPETVTGTQ